MNVNLHIESLILDGVDVEPAHRPALQAAVEAELSRLLARGGVGAELAAGGAVPSLRASGFEMSGAGNPRQLGRQIARAVYGGLQPSPPREHPSGGGSGKRSGTSGLLPRPRLG